MAEQGYNGWKNYETWAMALWIDNDEGSYDMSREMATQARQDVADRTATGCTEAGTLATMLRSWIEETQPEIENSVWLDLMTAAFSEVDWYEIAENYLSELVES